MCRTGGSLELFIVCLVCLLEAVAGLTRMAPGRWGLSPPIGPRAWLALLMLWLPPTLPSPRISAKALTMSSGCTEGARQAPTLAYLAAQKVNTET
jgi:hypothetical protein